ncbi:hypothetical protein Hanom_Chr03g00250561 [Helianthus anomalus]
MKHYSNQIGSINQSQIVHNINQSLNHNNCRISSKIQSRFAYNINQSLQQ